MVAISLRWYFGKFINKYMNNFCKLYIYLAALAVFVFNFNCSVHAQTATIHTGLNVAGSITLSDDALDTMAGKNPTLNVNVSVTPDVEETVAFDLANFRIRTNLSMWQLNAIRSGFSAGTTNLVAGDVALSFIKTAGSDGDSASCSLVAPFTGVTDLTMISTGSQTAVCTGTSMTANQVSDSTNPNNYVRFQTIYMVPQDFFYDPGVATDTITYTVVSL